MKNMDFEREYEYENMEKQIGGNLVSGDWLCMPDAGWRCDVFGFCRVDRYSYDLRKRKLDFVRKRKGSNTDSSFFRKNYNCYYGNLYNERRTIMKKFANDWMELIWKPQIKFIRRYWFIYILTCLAGALISVGITYASFIKEKIFLTKEKIRCWLSMRKFKGEES